LSEVAHVHHHRHHHHRTSPAPATKPQKQHYGDTRCPCIGFDNIKGETLVTFEDKVQASYPADLGARCEAWDDGRHPLCKEGETPGIGNGWCGQQWCYVDSCNCDLPVLPKVTSYIPDARYRGKPVFFSYVTCSGKDMWSQGVPPIGSEGCRCIGFDNIPGSTDIKLKLADGTRQVASYPAEIGGTCTAWDKDVHPDCRGADAPKWCAQKWCYVDPCSCDLAQPPEVTMYLPEATFSGKSLYYSYETCGSEDVFTEKFNVDACVNQDSKDECLKLKAKGGRNKCAWTGSKCLGLELVDHQFCKAVSGKSAAAGRAMSVVGFLAAAVAAIVR